MKANAYKSIHLMIAAAFIMSVGLSGCGSKKKATNVAKEEEELITYYCSGPDYRTDKKNFRANAIGESSDQMVARKKAMSNAKAALAGQIETVIKGTTDNYVNSREFNNTEEVEERFESLNREVINQQLNNVKTICQKHTRNKKSGKYKTYLAIEMNVDALEEAMKQKLSRDKQLKIDYDYEKYKETFEKEMEKLENQMGY
jgi:predicted transposase YbfD/YdcC